MRQRSRQAYGWILNLDAENTRQLLPPAYLHNVGAADFVTVGASYFARLTGAGGLRPTDRVLDVGSGTGRIARPLTTFLTSGTYDGIEIVKDSVEWCQRAYARYPNFHFQHADVRNAVYNPSGRCQAHEYRFPYDDGSFSYVILTSVFTHMLPLAVARYLEEIQRVLAPGGRVFATFFLLDDEARARLDSGQAEMTFDYDLPGCRVHLAESPEAAVAYDERDVLSLCARAGLEMSNAEYGAWSRRANGSDWQDIVLLQRR